MAALFKELDTRIKTGVYAVETSNDTCYYMELSELDDGVRFITDGKEVIVVQEGTVGGCCVGDEPVIRVKKPLHLANNGHLIVITSPVVSIERLRDDLEAFVCRRCSGFLFENTCLRCID